MVIVDAVTATQYVTLKNYLLSAQTLHSDRQICNNQIV